MFEHPISITCRKKRRPVEKKMDVDFTKCNTRQISYRTYSKSKICAVELEA
jgi:hypothetical protein